MCGVHAQRLFNVLNGKEFMLRKGIVLAAIFFLFTKGLFGEQFPPPVSSRETNKITQSAVLSNKSLRLPQAALETQLLHPIVYPEEIDLGLLRPGETATGTFFTKSQESADPDWFVQAPAGWEPVDDQTMSGLTGEAPERCMIALRYVKEIERNQYRVASLLLRLESGGRAAQFRREAPIGKFRETIKFHYVGGTQTVSFAASLEQMPDEPLLQLDEKRIDLGTAAVGETISRRIRLTNRGRKALEWKARVTRPVDGERYVSFRRAEPAVSSAPSLLMKTGLELLGGCAYDNQGYPSCEGEESLLRFKFTGTGLKLYFRKSLEGGLFRVFLDEQFIELFDSYATTSEGAEAFVVEGQTYGEHVLAISGSSGKTTFEGAGILGGIISRGPRGWLSVFPDSGTTTRETDYVTVSVNTRGLQPGIYTERVVFSSNGGNADLDLSLEIVKSVRTTRVDIYCYVNGLDTLFTANPKAEAARVRAKGYQYSGVAFKLFAPGTPGTTEFFRWYNPATGDYFYTHERDCTKAPMGYIFEGSLGNIATSKLEGTKALYRWYNSKTRRHFYTPRDNPEGMSQKGFYFDGIAGYVQ